MGLVKRNGSNRFNCRVKLELFRFLVASVFGRRESPINGYSSLLRQRRQYCKPTRWTSTPTRPATWLFELSISRITRWTALWATAYSTQGIRVPIAKAQRPDVRAHGRGPWVVGLLAQQKVTGLPAQTPKSRVANVLPGAGNVPVSGCPRCVGPSKLTIFLTDLRWRRS